MIRGLFPHYRRNDYGRHWAKWWGSPGLYSAVGVAPVLRLDYVDDPRQLTVRLWAETGFGCTAAARYDDPAFLALAAHCDDCCPVVDYAIEHAETVPQRQLADALAAVLAKDHVG